MVVVCKTSECAHNPKVCKTRLTIPSNQDVTLDVLSVSVGSFIPSFAYRGDATM
jgi:hypothetical protein